MNKLILGDNLEIMKTIPKETIDLIYLDPPFFSNRNYEVIWGDEGEIRSFQDRWSGGVDHYIAWLKERVIEMHRILKSTGSIFLHCDWHANAYIRVEILDKIFGYQNFRNEIIWQRTNAKSNVSLRFGINTDTIFFYAKSPYFKLNIIRTAYSSEQLSRYKNEDEKGLYRLDDLTAPNRGRQFIWRGTHPGENRSWRFSHDKLEQLYAQGLIGLQKNGTPRKDGLKKYLTDSPGAVLNSLWNDVERVGNTSHERIGYPTQKPEALLRRIVECASNEGGVVMDPFVGGGTTIAVADKLNRQWIGIDQSVQAVKVTELRLQNQMNLFSQPFVVQLHKYDYDMLRYQNAFAFETWIVEQFGGTPNVKQRNDFGMDGKTKDNVPIQVKRSDNIGRNVVDNFHSAVMRYDKTLYEKNRSSNQPVGYIIAFSFSKGAIQEVARLHNQENVIVKLVTVEEIVPISKKPSLTVDVTSKGVDQKGVHEIYFKATGTSQAGIEFYSWDFDWDEKQFKAEVLLDKSGEQTWKFKPGQHQVAVKVVDNDGLENIEVIRLKVNGIITRL